MAFNDGCASELDGLRPGIKRSDPDDVSEMMKSYSVVESSVSENPHFSNTMLSDYPLDDDKNCSSNEGAPISRPGFTPLSAPESKPTSYPGITSSSVPVPKPALTPEHSPSSVLGSRLCTAPLPRTLSTTVPKPPSSVDSAISSTLGIRQTSAPGTCPSINEDNLLRTVQNPSEGSEDRLTPSIDCIYTSSYAHQDTTATSFDHMSRNLSGVESLIQSNISLTNGAACPSISEEQKQGDASIRTIGKVVESMIHRHILETSKDSTDSTVKRSDSIARRHNVTPTIAENRESISRCSGNEATSINIFSPSSSRAADSISEAKSIICQVCETSFQSTSSELLKTAGCSGFNSPSLDTYTASQATTPTLNTVNCNQINAFPFVASAVKTHSSDTSATATCSVVDAPLSVVVAMTSPTSDNREITSPASVVTASTSPSFVTTSTLPASVATAVKSPASFVRATSPSSVVTATTSPSSVVSAMTSPASDVRAITSPSSVVPASTLPASVTAMTSPASDVKATSSTSVVTASTIPTSIITAMTSPASNVRTTISPASVVTTSASPALVVTAMTSPSLDAIAMTSPSSVVPATTSPSSVVSAMTSSVSDVRAITSPSSVVTATTSSSSVFTTTTSLASVLTASTLPASVTAMTSPASDVRTTSSASVVTATASSSSVFTTTTSLASVLTASTSPAFDTTSILPASVATAVASPASFVRATSPASVVTASTVPASVTAMTSPASDVRATSSASVVTATTSSSSVFTTTTSPSSVTITMTSPASDVRATSPESVVAASTIPASVITAMTSPASNFRATISPASVVTASVSPTSVVTATTSPSVDATAMTSPASFVTASASPASVVTASASPESGVAATMSLSSVFNASTVPVPVVTASTLPASVEIAISLASVPQPQVNRDRQHWNAPRFPFPYAYGEMRMPSSSRFPFWNQAHWRTAGKDHGYRYTVPCTMSSGPPLPPSCSVTSGSVHTPYQGSGTSTYGAAVFPSNRDMHQLGTLEQPAVRRNGDDLNNIMSKVCSPLQKKAKEEKQYSCKYCKNVRFKTKSGQETHLYRFHDPDKKPGSSRTSVVGHDVYHSAMPPAAVNRFPSAMPDPVVKYHCNKCGEDFLSSSDFRVHINTQNCRVGIAVYDSCIKLQCDGGDRCSFVNSSQSNNKSNAVNDSRADTTDVQLIITEPIKNKFDQSNDKRTGRADNASSTNEIMKDKLDQSNDKRTGRADNASSTNEIMMAKLDQSNDTRTGRADSASSTNEIMMAKLDQSNDTRTGSANIASSANEIMKAKLDQSKDRKTETANGVLLTKESMMLNQCVLAKKDNIFYLATVKTINKKGTVGVLFKGEEELTYLFNALDPTDRLVISISVPSADSLEIGCKVCVTLSHEQNKFYDGEIKDMRTGSLICYKVCLIHKKDINMFGEALWVHRTAVRLLESPWYRLPANKLGLSKVRDLTGKLQVLKVSTIRPSNKSSSHKHANSIYYNCLTCHSTFASCLAYKIHQGKMHKDETVKGMKILDDEYSIEKSENFSEKSHESYICSSSERTCEDEGKCDSGDETDIYVSDEDSNTGFGGMLTIISESSKESRDAPIESKDRKVERKVVDKENKSDGTELIFKCDYCGDKFQTAKCLRQHRNQHIQKYPYFCDICEKTFKNKDNLRGHLEICKAKKNSNVNIGRKHLENVSSTKKKGYACLDCDKVFSYKTNRSRHEKLIHPNTSGETEMYICQFCSKTFTHQQALYRHKKYIHGKSMNGPMGKQTTVTNCKPSDSMGRGAAGSHVCDVCKKTYSSEDALHQHKLIHSNKCSVCNAVFARKIKLRFHHRKHHSDSGKSVVGLTCDVCSRTFNIKKQLKIHKLVHLSKEPFKCTWCIKMFAQKAALVEHIKNHHTKNETGGNKALVVKVLLKCPEKALNCSVCDREFSTRLGLSMHIQHAHKRKAAKGHRSNHTDEKRRTTAASLSCDVCTKTFITHQHLQRHRNTHLLIKPFKCTPCNKTFAQKGQLRVHNDTHHHGKTGKGRYKQHDVGKALLKSSEKVLRCSLCERDFSTRVGFRMHNFHVHRLTAAGGSQAMHDSSNYTDEKGRTKAVSFACDLCTKTFSKHQHLQQHRNTHLSIKPFKCTPCNKTFAQKGQLRVHNDTHHHGKTGKGRYKQHDVGKALLKSSEKVLRCSLCERDFSTREGLRKHNFHVHRLTAADGSEAMHDSSNHTDKRERTKSASLTCDVCTKTFITQTSLKRHRNIHLLIKPFKCTLCNKTFAQKVQLRVHIDTHHHVKTEKGIYKQQEVGKALLKSSEEALSCSLCDRDFSTRAGIRMHNFHIHKWTAAGASEAMHDSRSILQSSSGKDSGTDEVSGSHFSCGICSTTFESGEMLHKHFRTSKCALGSFSRLMAEQRKDSVLTNPDVVSEHSERKSVEYQCGICDLTFPDSSFLELHMTQGCPGRFVKQEYPIENYSSKKLNLFQCGICHLDFSTEIELVSHFQVMHSATKSKNDFENFPDYICGRCNSVFDSGNGLAVHMKACFNGNASELDLETFSCGICQKDFRSADELESHVDIHTQSEYLCGQCGLSFRASDTLIKHVLEEHSCGNAMAIVNSPELEIKDNDIEDVATHINEHDIEDVEADFNGHNIEDVEADVNDHKIEDVEADIIDHNIEDVETDINDHYIEDVEADINDHDIEDVEADINDNDIVNVEADINDHDIEDIEADINDNDIVNVEADINDHNIEAVGTDLNDTCIEHVEADINDHDIEDIAADINDNDIEEVAADLLVVNTDTSLYRNYEVVRENESQRKSVERGVEPFVTDEYTNKDELLENNLVVKTSAAVSNDIVIYPHLYRPSTIINSGNQHTYDISVMPTIVNRPGMPKHATKNRQGMQDVTQISPEVQQYDALNTPRIHQLEDQDLTGLVHNDTQNIGQQCINPYTYPTNSIQSEQIRAPLPNVGFRYPSSQARQLSTLLPGQTHFNIPIHPNIPSLLSNQRITSETSSILSHVPTLVAQFNAINVHKTNNETISYAGILTAETTSIQSSVSQLDYQPKSAFPVVQSTETAIIQNSTSPKSVNRNQSANSEPPFVLVCLCIRCGRYGEPKGSRFYCKACKVLFGNLCCAYCSRTTFQDQFELERHIHSCETYCSKQSRGALKEFRDKQMKSAISLSSVSKQKINENSLCPDTRERPQYNRCVENSSIIKALAEETEKEFMHGGDKRICAQIDSVCISTSSSNTVNVREANNGLHGKANAMENKPVTPYEQLTQMKIKHDNATGSCLEESKSKDKFEGRFGKCVTLQNIPSIVSANTRKKPKVTTAVVDNTSDSTQTSSNRTSSLHPEFNTTENKSVPTDIENDNTANFYNDAGSSDIHYFASLLPTVVSDPDTTKGSSSGVCHVENNRDECHEYNSKGVTVSDEIPVTGRQTENGADEVVNSDSSKENLVHILNFPDDCIYLNDRKDESVRNDIAEAITEAESVEGRAGDKTRALGSPDTHVDEQTEESTKSPAHSSLYAGIGVQAENALFSDVTSCNHSAGNIIESESEESDGSGFEEIEIDEENIIEESNPRNKYSDIICYDDDINRKNMKSHTSSMIRFDRSNIKIIPCKVILERILRSEVEQITEKNKRRKAIQYLDKREETCVNNKKLSEMKTKSKEKSNSETNTVTKQGQSCEHPVLSLLKKRKQMLLEIRRTNAAIAREKARGIMLIKRRTQYIERNKRTELPKRPITRQETTLNQKKRKRKVNLVDSEGDMVQSDKRRISVDKSRTKLNHMKSRVKTSAKSRVKTSAVVDKVKKLKLQDVVLLCTDSDASGEISSNVLSTTKARECKRLKRTVIPSKKNDITGQVHISKAIVVLEKVMAHKVGVSTEQIQAHKTVGVTEQVQARKVIGVTDQLLTHKAVIELEKIQALKATGATKQVQTRKVVDVTEKLHTRKAVVVLDDIQAHKVVCETEKAQTSKTVGVAENETDCAKANTVYDRTDVRAGIEADSRYVNDDTVSNNDQMHAAEEYFSCEICTVQLSSTKELEEHAKSHLTFDEYKCRECNKTFSTVDTLNKHFEYHKQKEEFLCGICQAQFALPSNLEIHMMEHFEGIVADQKHSETVVRVKSTETVPADSVAQGSGGNPSQPLLSKLLAYKHKFT